MKLTIYKKMMLGFGTIILVMIIASTYILLQLNAVSNAAKTAITSHARVVDLAKQLQAILLDENGYAQKYLISRDEAYFSLFIETSRRIEQYLDSLLKSKSNEIERSLIRNMRQVHVSYVDYILKQRSNSGSEHDQLHDSIRPYSMETLYKSLDHLINLKQVSIGNAISGMEATTDRSAKIALLLLVCTLMAAITSAFIITRTITRPIGDLIKGTERIARGKFEQINVSSKDEIALLAHAVNDMSDKIKEINELRTQIMQQISHEVQTPLQSMLSAHDLLKNQYPGPLNEEQQELLDTIFRGINKLGSFSKQYLDLSKIESGMMKYQMVQADLIRIVEPLVEDARLVAARKNISIQLSTLPAPQVMVDVEKISIVVNNLLTNAIKYTHTDGKISVNVGPCTLGTRLEVHDSGIGINGEELIKVFDKFYQAENVDRTKSRGTGVGLALVKAYTDGHSGKVHVESNVDQGSTFSVELPAAPDVVRIPEENVPVEGAK